MTPDQLAEIEARAAAATAGPWTNAWSGHIDGAPPNFGTVTRSGFRRGEDAWFVANARTDVPALVAEVRRLRGHLQTIRDRYGRVCAGFELCSHSACESSVGAWFESERVLEGANGDRD